jgi:hypoxanthine phosphoribosyltransferase
MKSVTIHNKEFNVYLESGKIEGVIREMAEELAKEYADKNPLFVGVLNGSFRFASDLMKHIEFPCEINFVKLTSYRGTESSGKVKDLIGFNSEVEGRHVVVLEDIVDTGHTWEYLHKLISDRKPASLKIATLLFKPTPYLSRLPIHHFGFEIPNLFVVGYGLDYDGYGRNLNDIYQIKS